MFASFIRAFKWIDHALLAVVRVLVAQMNLLEMTEHITLQILTFTLGHHHLKEAGCKMENMCIL